jgi:hypothetical protein
MLAHSPYSVAIVAQPANFNEISVLKFASVNQINKVIK